VSPDALDRNGIATAQTLTAGSPSPILDGALTAGYDLDAVATAQTTGAAAALDLDGVVGTGPHRVRGTAERLVVTSASDNSGITYAIVGKDKDGNSLTETLTGSAASQKVFSANAYWSLTSITSSAAVTGNVTVGINGVATFATPQHITIWATSDESGGSFVLTGTDRNDVVQTESVVGPTASATVVSTKNFKTLTHVLSPAAATGVEIGVDGTCESGWLPVDHRTNDFGVALGVVVSSGATLTYDVQHTFDDVFQTPYVGEDTFTAFTHEQMNGKTANDDGNYAFPPMAVRFALTAHTSGSIVGNVIQQSN
jgi:hypothetical protein